MILFHLKIFFWRFFFLLSSAHKISNQNFFVFTFKRVKSFKIMLAANITSYWHPKVTKIIRMPVLMRLDTALGMEQNCFNHYLRIYFRCQNYLIIQFFLWIFWKFSCAYEKSLKSKHTKNINVENTVKSPNKNSANISC